ncbi:MAG TPA: ABC transporter ATP-binding protein [Thermodesulfobacteriota bacterium]|jgi:lipopolysaccharide transport system ATP-binding protein|nr:ABC transporter ATP-binding protein [Thermodesulfobacteriota bacterium]
MSGFAIRAENLTKLYRIGEKESYYALRDVLSRSIRAPLRWFSLNPQKNNGKSPVPSHVWALKGVSFEIGQGEVVGIIGRNGAGKSTLLKVLSRITEPTEGYAEIRGRVGSLLEVGTGFHPELTGRENIFLNGAILGMTRREIKDRFDEIVAFAEIERFIDTPVKRYSSGMYVRLAFAVAAHLEPEILLVDEVLAVGDAAFQKKCINKIQDVGRQGRTVLFVSHSMPAITRLCQRAILLGEGRILCDGPSHEVVGAYLQSGVGTSALREWPDLDKAPGNDIVRLSSVRVLDESGNVSDTIDIRESVRIEIEYYNFPNNRFPYASIQLLDENDVCLFSSGDFNNLDWRHRPRVFEGRVISTCTIPGNLLSEGLKRVLVALTTHNPNEVLAIERDAVSFMVVDRSEGDGARGEFTGYFPGVMRPLLYWEVDYTDVTKVRDLPGSGS